MSETVPVATLMHDLAQRPIQHKPRAEELAAAADQFPAVLQDGTQAEHAAELIRMMRAMEKKVDEERMTWKRPLLDYIKALDSRFNVIRNLLEKSRKDLNRRLTAYQVEQDRKAREAEARARREQEEQALAEAHRLEQEGRTDEAAEVLDYGSDAPAPIVDHRPTIRGHYGASSNLRTTWEPDFSRVDMRKVPLEYLTVDQKKVREAVRRGVRNIPGIPIVEREQSVVR